jgi:hypothetical protein
MYDAHPVCPVEDGIIHINPSLPYYIYFYYETNHQILQPTHQIRSKHSHLTIN